MAEKQYQETKKHGSRLFPFNIYPCTIPLDFPAVLVHWHREMELIYVKKEKDGSRWGWQNTKAGKEIFL